MYEINVRRALYGHAPREPRRLRDAQLTDKCDALKGELLIIHGLQDNVVLPEHSYTFLKDCITKGQQVEFFTYPGHEHNVRGKDRLHLMTKVLDRWTAR